MTKKILFIITQSEFGGAQRFLANFTTALNKNKYDIAVGAGPEGDDKNGLLSFLEKKGINTKHLKYLRRGVNPLFDYLGMVEILGLIKKEKPDTLFLCSSKAGALGALAGRLTGVKKVIYRIGGWAFNDPWPYWKKKLYILIEKWSAKFKDIIINNSESDRKQAINLKIKPKDKIITIYNGINTESLEFVSRKTARKFLKFKDSDFVVGTIANDYPSKGLKYLKKAAKDLPSIKFVIIGTGNKFIPDAYKYLKAFDIFVLPSVKEGFPWTILEAMAAEVPIVATKVGAISEIQPGLLVEPGNSKELSSAIRKLLKNRDLRNKLTNQSKKTVKDKFSLERMVNNVEKLL